jgi:hypothetical protein
MKMFPVGLEPTTFGFGGHRFNVKYRRNQALAIPDFPDIWTVYK